MRTSLRINDELMREARQLAARTGKTLTAIIEDALRESFRKRNTVARVRVNLPTESGHGLLPGVDLDDSSALLDILEGG